jgi:hypothetical protein
LGSAAGLSAWVITRLTSHWQAEHQAFARRDLSEVDYMYCWADRVSFSIRLGEQGRVCCLVIVVMRGRAKRAGRGRRWGQGVGRGLGRAAAGSAAPRQGCAKVTDHAEPLLSFFDDPAERWAHLRTTNPIERSFAPVRVRTCLTKRPRTEDTGLSMVFKLLQAAQGRRRAVNGPCLVALVAVFRAGGRLEAGKLAERPGRPTQQQAA